MVPVDVLVNVQVNPLHDFDSPATGPAGGGGGGGPPPPMKPTYNNLLGVPAGKLGSFPNVAFVVSALTTCAGVAVGFAERYNAAPPAT